MKYIQVDWDDDTRGFHLKTRDYLAALQRGIELPPGAAEFAHDPGHYDFTGRRCVKDLALDRVSWSPTGPAVLRLTFLPHPAKHDARLTLTYRAVSDFSLTRAEPDPATTLPDRILLDELLPAPSGCTHEIELTNSSITITCADLEAVWSAPR